MNINGIWANQAHLFHPDQWVNVWLVRVWGSSEYYSTCQVKSLDELLDDPDDYGLEPIHPDGTAMPLTDALTLQPCPDLYLSPSYSSL